MIFEHFALNVRDARSVSRWYIKNLGLSIAKSLPDAPYTTFLRDDAGRVVLELYSNADFLVTDYSAVHPRSFHVAFLSNDPDADHLRLVAEGAKLEYRESSADGSVFVMVRDPWGIPLQLVKRATPF